MIFNNNINNVRNNLMKFLIERGSIFSNALMHNSQYRIQLKGWCIAVFMASLGFCISKDILYCYFFPLITVIIFWFYNTYENYMSGFARDKIKENDKLIKTIYQIDDINKLLKIFDKADFYINWSHKGDFIPKRFFKKIEVIFKPKNFFSLDNLSLYGSLLVIWIFTFLKIINDQFKFNITDLFTIFFKTFINILFLRI